MNLDIPIIRSNRKTISLQVERDGSISVRAPKILPELFIQNFINENKLWISKHWKKEQSRERVKRTFSEGESFLYLGDHYPLTFSRELSRPFHFDEAFIVRHQDQARARDLLIKWYKRRARTIIGGRADHFAEAMCLNYGKFRLSSARYTWGSCTPENNLNLTWRLVLAPLAVLDYVVVHELAHTKHKNHGKRFWRLVENWIPEYRVRRRWLHDHNHLLDF